MHIHVRVCGPFPRFLLIVLSRDGWVGDDNNIIAGLGYYVLHLCTRPGLSCSDDLAITGFVVVAALFNGNQHNQGELDSHR